MTFILEDNKKKFILEKKIGKGATCKCYLGHKLNEDNPEDYAIKIFPEKYYQYYSNEIKCLTKLQENNNIIKLYGYGKGFLFDISNYANNSKKKFIYYQILEYASNGELKDYVNGSSTRIPENIAAKLFIKILKAVQYLHENNIAHCDLKPENILLDDNFNPKINDFGFSQEFNGERGNYLLHKRSGTPKYSSPDVRFAFTKGYDGIKNDIFSLGVLLFVITIGAFPFESTTYSDEKYKFIIKGRYRQFWEFFNDIDTSEEFKDLINSLLSLNPSKRLSINEILNHPWILKQLGINNKEEYGYLTLNESFNDENFDKEIFDEFNSRKKLQ